MIATELEVDLTLPSSVTPRSEGIHVSGIIRCIASEHGLLKHDMAEDLSLTDAREITDPVALRRIHMGLAWEQYYVPTLPDVADHPGEMHFEGVYMTHDGESLDVIYTSRGKNYHTVVHEVKCTWKSLRGIQEALEQGAVTKKVWMWITQIMAYCKALGTRFAVLHVYFVNGDYSYPLQPAWKKWFLEFTQEEIDTSWELLSDYMKYKLEEED